MVASKGSVPTEASTLPRMARAVPVTVVETPSSKLPGSRVRSPRKISPKTTRKGRAWGRKEPPIDRDPLSPPYLRGLEGADALDASGGCVPHRTGGSSRRIFCVASPRAEGVRPFLVLDVAAWTTCRNTS